MLVLLLAPMRSELQPIVKKLSLTSRRSGGLTVHTGRAGPAGRGAEIEVVAATVGVGPIAAARATEQLLNAFSVDHVMLSGIAGAVEPDCPIGTVFVPEVVIDGATKKELRPTGWGDLALSGTIMTTSGLITEPRQIDELRQSGVVALEMEGSGVGEVCVERNKPWTVFRSISDRAGDGAVDDSVLAMLNEDGSTNAKAAAKHILTHPLSLPGLARLAKDSTTAARAAATAAIDALNS